MTVIQRLELLAEDVKKLEGEGGGGDLSAYLTKDEASNTYETQTAASSALALKADAATTYTKTEVDSAIANGPEPVLIPLNSDTGTIPEDKRYVFSQHLPFKFSQNGLILTFDLYYGNGYYYSAKTGFQIAVAFYYNPNNATYRIITTTGGGEIEYITQVNSIRYLLDKNHHAKLNNAGSSTSSYDYYPIDDNTDLNNFTSPNIYYRQNSFTSIANCPVSEPFYMIDENLNGNTNTHNQILFAAKDPTCFYKRTKYFENSQSVFTDWYKFSADVETATSSETLPSAGTGTTFDTGIEWSYIQTMNDFILDSSGEKIKFRYGFTKGSKLHYFGYILDSGSTTQIAHLEIGAPTGSGTTALATWISSGAIPTT